MQLLFIVCPEPLEDELRALLDKAGAPGWTESRHLIGKGHTGPRLGSAIWPGNNSMFMVAVDGEVGEKVKGALKAYASKWEGRPGGMSVRTFVVPCEELT